MEKRIKYDFKCPECGKFTMFSHTEDDIGKEDRCSCGHVFGKLSKKWFNDAWEDQSKHNKQLNESVLDPVQKQRCDAMFNPNDKREQPVLLFSTKQFIFSLLDKFREETGLKKMEYVQAFIVGSSLGYQYRDDCDIDVDVRVNLTREELKGKFHCIPKNIILPNTAHPVNIYLLTADDDEYDFSNAESAYDLLTDTWIKQGRLENADAIPFEYVAGVSEFLMDGIVLELSRAERDLYDLDKYVGMDPNKVAITESERKAAISQKISELIIDKDALKLAHTIMFRLDGDGFGDKPINVSIKYTYEDKHYSMNNLIYKYIDKYGYYEKIEEMAKTIDEAIKKAKKALEVVAENSPETLNTAEAQAEVLEKVQSTEVPEAQPVEEVPTEEPVQEEQQAEAVEQNQLTESYTDDELKAILLENGMEDTDLNVLKLRIHPYFIANYYDPEYDACLEESFKDLRQKLIANDRRKFENKTYGKLDKIIYKASGKKDPAVNGVVAWLCTGMIGGAIAYELALDRNVKRDDFERELINRIEYDTECQNILADIKEELNKPEPDKAKLKELKHKFAKAVSAVKKYAKKDVNKMNQDDRLSASEIKPVTRHM